MFKYIAVATIVSAAFLGDALGRYVSNPPLPLYWVSIRDPRTAEVYGVPAANLSDCKTTAQFTRGVCYNRSNLLENL